MADDNTKDHKGRWIKGVSGNPKGRPKGIKEPTIPESARQMFKDDPVKALKWLMNTATVRADLAKYAKMLIEYTSPKLKSIETTQKIDKTITVQWQQIKDKKSHRMKIINEIPKKLN